MQIRHLPLADQAKRLLAQICLITSQCRAENNSQIPSRLHCARGRGGVQRSQRQGVIFRRAVKARLEYRP